MNNQQGNYLKSGHLRNKNLSKLEKIGKKLISINTGVNNSQGLFLKFILDQYHKKDISVLDVGTGDGWCLFSYNSPQIKKKLFMDIDSNFKEYIQTKGGTFLQENIQKTTLQNNSVDIIIMNHVLEHIPDMNSTLNELKRILKKGGIAVIRVPDIQKVKFQFFDDYTHIKPFTKKSIQQLFRAYDFKILRCENFNYEKFMINHIFTKKPLTCFYTRGKEIFLIVKK